MILCWKFYKDKVLFQHECAQKEKIGRNFIRIRDALGDLGLKKKIVSAKFV